MTPKLLHVMNLPGKQPICQFTDIASQLGDCYFRYTPCRFTKEESDDERSGIPKILQEMELPLLDGS